MLQSDKLRHAHQYNLDSVDDKYTHLLRCDKEYEELITTLERLSDDFTQDIMVPLTKKAFVPGQLIHTNEVMVYVGDNWFVNRTVRQGIDMAKRRREHIQKEMADHQKVMDNIRNKMSFSDELEGEPIMEELTAEDVERSRTRHKAHVPKNATVHRPRPAFSAEELERFKNIVGKEDTDDSCNDSSSSSEYESESESSGEEVATVIKFSHSPGSHHQTRSVTDGLHPGNLDTLLRTNDATADSNINRTNKENYNVNSARVEERSTRHVSRTSDTTVTTTTAATTTTTTAAKRPVSKFKMSRSKS